MCPGMEKSATELQDAPDPDYGSKEGFLGEVIPELDSRG